MLPWLFTIFLLSITSARPSPSSRPGYWIFEVSDSEPRPHYFCSSYIPAGTPFLGLLSNVQLEDIFITVGKHYEDLPLGMFVLESLTARGFQVLLHIETGDRYQRFPPAGFQSGQYLDMQACGYMYRWGPLEIEPAPTASISNTIATKIDNEAGTDSIDDGTKEAVFSHNILMDREGEGRLYHLFWNFNEEGITFKVVAETIGYVTLGFSPTGIMDDADVVVAWVDDDGVPHLEDRHADEQGRLVLDNSQDVEMQMGYKNTTHTVFQFYRVWDTCDEDDYKLGTDTVRVVWSYHQDLDLSQRPSREGVMSLYLQEPQLDHSSLKPHSFWDVTAGNAALPGDDHTHYFCRIVKVPEQVLTSKHHIIELEPLIQPGSEPYVHDITLRECIAPEFLGSSNEELFEGAVGQPGEECYGPDMPDQWHFCTIIMGWAVGNNGVRLPEHVGLALGEQFGGATYYRLQVHYHNQGIHPDIIDNSGLRIYYSDKPREMDMGVMDTGASVNMLFMVPPSQNLFMSTGHCSADCTSQTIPEDGIKVWMGLLHTHEAARKVRVRHVRDGVELPVLFEDNSYDYNFQANRYPLAGSEVHHEVLVMPGDSLITECEYDTSDRTRPTYGGLGTIAEQCLAFLLYYPRMTLQSCRSSPTVATFFKSLGIEKVIGDSEDLFEKLMSFTLHQTVGPRNQGNITEIVKNLSSEVVDYYFDGVFKQLSDPRFFKDFRLQQDVLVEILKKIKIEAPDSLRGMYVGELFERIDWSEGGPEMSKVTARDDHRLGCFPRDGVTQLIEYKPRKIPSFTSLEKEENICENA